MFQSIKHSKCNSDPWLVNVTGTGQDNPEDSIRRLKYLVFRGSWCRFSSQAFPRPYHTNGRLHWFLLYTSTTTRGLCLLPETTGSSTYLLALPGRCRAAFQMLWMRGTETLPAPKQGAPGWHCTHPRPCWRSGAAHPTAPGQKKCIRLAHLEPGHMDI